jgi:hypothetical protein
MLSGQDVTGDVARYFGPESMAPGADQADLLACTFARAFCTALDSMTFVLYKHGQLYVNDGGE